MRLLLPLTAVAAVAFLLAVRETDEEIPDVRPKDIDERLPPPASRRLMQTTRIGVPVYLTANPASTTPPAATLPGLVDVVYIGSSLDHRYYHVMWIPQNGPAIEGWVFQGDVAFKTLHLGRKGT